MANLTETIHKLVNQVITESAKIKFAGHTFVLKVDTNEDPHKKGVKVQFLPTQFGQITATEQDDIAMELEKRLDKGLDKFELRVERDRNLKDKTIIGFFIYIEYFDRIIRQALTDENPQGGSPGGEEGGEEEPQD